MKGANRISGIETIGDIPWGMHFCQFYQTKEDLMEMIIPYFKAGLENNEFCLWALSDQLDEEEAKKALKVAIPNIDAYLHSGQIEIVPYIYWHVEKGALDPQMALNHLIEKTSKALASGYDGLRYSGNDFCGYEKILDSVIGKYPVIVLCTYLIDKCSATDILDIVANHQFALIKREDKWERIESSCQKNIMKCKQNEKALQESEERYKAIFDNSLDGIFVTTPEGTILAANPAACQMFGMTEEEIIRAGRKGVVDISDPRFKSLLEERARTGRFKGELNHRRKDGTIFPGEISSAFFKDKDGLVKGVIIIRDISERKQLEEQTRQRVEELEAIMEAAPVGIWIGHDPQCHNITGNRMTNGLYEAEAGENLSANVTPVRRFFHKGRELTADELPMQKAAFKDIDVRNEEVDVLLPSGEWRALLGSASPLHDTNGNVRGSVGAFVDVTERKRMEEALRENEERFTAFMDNSPAIAWMKDEQGRHIYLNKSYENHFNIRLEDWRGKTDFELWPFKIANQFWENDRAVLKGGRTIEVIEETPSPEGGSTFWWNFKFPFQDASDKKYVGGIGIDITELKRMEEALKKVNETLEEKVKERTTELQKAYDSLKKSEKSLAEAQEMAHIGSWERDFSSNEYNWSDEMYRIFGLKPQETKDYDTLLNYVHPDDRDYIDNAIKEKFKGKPLDINYRIILTNGEERIVHSKAELVFDEKNNPIRIKGTTQDITERKKIEEELQNAYSRLRTFFNLKLNGFGIAIANAEGEILEANDYYLHMLGLSREELEAGTVCWLEMTPSEWLPADEKSIAEMQKKGFSTPYEKEYIRKDGSRVPVLIANTMFPGSYSEILAFVLDITQHKQAEKALRKSKEQYQTIFNSISEGFAHYKAIYDEHGVLYDLLVLEINPAGAKFSGVEQEAQIGKTWREVWPDVEDYLFGIYNEVDQTGKSIRFESLSNITGRWYVTQIDKIEKGQFAVTFRDITERKIGEENLRLSEEKYRSFVQNFRGIAFQIDKNFKLEFIHGAIKEITGYSEEELFLYTSWKHLVTPEDIDMFLEAEQKAAQSPSDYHVEIEYRIKTKDGKIKWMHEFHQKISGKDGGPEKYTGLIYDITEKKEIEEALAKFEIARQKEIHHRIKNNLQVISSLLDLQAEKFNNRECVSDSEVLEAFRESQDRVISMALIHEELYKGGGFEKLNFSPYIQELADTLFHTYRLGNTDISLNMDLEENLLFDMDTAVPLGIIINELVSNSLKHAFIDRDRGEIRIKLHREEPAELESEDRESTSTNFTLTISDNGVGIPENLDIENLDSLGMQLVTSLVDQLDGEIELKRDNGTEFTIRFTVTEKNE